MNRTRPLLELAVATTLVVIAGATARADAIDGNWCHDDGRRIAIAGPRIVTPGGSHIEGEYDRHHFAYVVPAGEPGAGQAVTMILRSEYLMHMRQGGPEAPLQVWNRCSATVSDAPAASPPPQRA